MARKSAPRLPVTGRFFFSVGNYQENAELDPEFVDLYARNAQGIWFVNGLKTDENEIPDDLWEVRTVQR
jgi:hypothetical protein